MDYKAIEDLIKVMSESKLTSLHIEGERLSIKMAKNEVAPMVKDNLTLCNEVKNIETEISSLGNKEKKVIVSPIVGTFYSSSSPETDGFVKIGSQVKKGDVLCIIEAMKLMNEIESDVEGEIIDILVEDGSMVEYGQKLFVIKEK